MPQSLDYAQLHSVTTSITEKKITCAYSPPMYPKLLLPYMINIFRASTFILDKLDSQSRQLKFHQIFPSSSLSAAFTPDETSSWFGSWIFVVSDSIFISTKSPGPISKSHSTYSYEFSQPTTADLSMRFRCSSSSSALLHDLLLCLHGSGKILLNFSNA